MVMHQASNSHHPLGLTRNADGSRNQSDVAAPSDRWDDVLVSRQRQRYLASLVTAEAHPSDSRCLEP